MANLNPGLGTEAGKVRPVVIVQTDLLNDYHPSTIICPITTNISGKYPELRVRLQKQKSGLQNKSEIMIDQIRTIDLKRLRRKIGNVPEETMRELEYWLAKILNIQSGTPSAPILLYSL